MLARTSTRDVTLHGRTIPAGKRVLLLVGSANRDERVFDRPDEFDPARPTAEHLAFGIGIHYCLGASPARLEGRVALEEFPPRGPDDRTIFEELLDRADVLVENFRPGALERLGYGWETLQARWPRLVYGATSGFGHTGPLRERPAFDMVVQAMGGLMSLTGYPG